MNAGSAKRLVTLATAAALLAACAQQPPPPQTWRSQADATRPTPLPVRVVTAADTPSQPAEPERITGAGAVGRTILASLGGGLVGIGYGAAAGIPSGPFGMVALAGAGAAVGIVVGLVGGGIEAGRAVHSDADAAQAAVILLRQLDPARAGGCLRDTLVSRSAGRMVAADATTDARLTVGLEEVSLIAEPTATDSRGSRAPGRQLMPANPPMRLHLHLQAPPQARPDQGAPTYGAGDWPWTGAGKRYFDWAARDGAAVQEQLEIGIGVLAQKLLADLYPADFQPPPAQGAESLRTRCSGPPAQPSSPVLIRTNAAAEQPPAR